MRETVLYGNNYILPCMPTRKQPTIKPQICIRPGNDTEPYFRSLICIFSMAWTNTLLCKSDLKYVHCTSRVYLYINGTFVRRNASRIIIIRKITKRTPLKGWMTHRMSSFREEKKCLRKWGEETQELTQMWSIAFGAKSMFSKQKSKVTFIFLH